MSLPLATNYAGVVALGYEAGSAVMKPVSVDTNGYINSSATLSAMHDNGDAASLAATGEGHLEVAMHAPITPFGDVLSSKSSPIFADSAIYGINTRDLLTTSATGGGVTQANGLWSCTTGTSVGGYGVLQSRKRIQYQGGQGSIARVSALFTTGVALSSQIAGIGHAESGLYVGYQNTNFGIQYVTGGVRAVVTLTITVASSNTENVTVTLNSVANTVAVTNSGNIQRSVWELAQGTYSGWRVTPVGATLIFVQGAAGPITIGNFSITATSLAGTFASTTTGVTATTTFVAQSSWNGDKMDGTGASGVTLNPLKLNNYQLQLSHTSNPSVYVHVSSAANNNADYVRVHTFNLANTLTGPTFTNPSAPLTIAAVSQGSTTNLTVSSAALSGFTCGDISFVSNRYSYPKILSATITTSLRPFFTLINSNTFLSKANQKSVFITAITGSLKHTQPAYIYVIRSTATGGITLTGNPNFSQFESNSCIYKDESATGVTVSSNAQYLYTMTLSETSSFNYDFNERNMIVLQPGEYLAVCGITDSGTANTFAVSLTWREVN